MRAAGRRWRRRLLYVALTAAYLLPLYVMVVTGLKSFAEVSLATMWSLPRGLSLEHFFRAWWGSRRQGYVGLRDRFVNSVVMVVPAALLSSLLGSLATGTSSPSGGSGALTGTSCCSSSACSSRTRAS